LLTWAETRVASGPAALIVATVPLWVASLEAVLPRGQTLPARGWAGVALGLAGLGVLNWPQLTQAGTSALDPVGVGMVVIASLSWAAGTLFMRRNPVDLDPLAATGWEMLLGGLINLALGLAFTRNAVITWSLPLLGSLAYLVVFGSIVAFSAYVWLVHNVPPAKVATYAYVNPVIAVLLGAWLLSEPVDGYTLAGMVVILASVILVTSATARARVAAPTPAPAARAPAQPIIAETPGD
jgi:drug/metabolite transporter (DMT)-like permease